MAWWEYIDEGADAIGSIMGLLEANEDSKNALNPSEVYMAGNPSSSNPLFSVANSWNGGKPTSDVTLTPEMQILADNMFASTSTPFKKRTRNEGARELQNANQNWQRARYGLEPIAFDPNQGMGASEPDPSTPSPSEQGSGSLIGGDTGSGGIETMGIDQNLGGAQQGGNQDAINMILEGILGGGNQGSGGFGDFGGQATEGNMQHILDSLGLSDTYNATDLESLMGHKDIGSLNALTLGENGGKIGSLIGALAGIPGLGFLGGKLGDKFVDSKTWMSPVDPDNPYGNNDLGVGDPFAIPEAVEFGQNPEGLPRSGMDEGITNQLITDFMHGNSNYGTNPVTTNPGITPNQSPQQFYGDPDQSMMGGTPVSGGGGIGGGGGWGSIMGNRGQATRIKR